MLFSPKSNQRKERKLSLTVDGTGTASITTGSGLATLVDNGTGDYTLTFAKPFTRTPTVQITTVTAATTGRAVKSLTDVQVLTFAMDGTTATDAEFDLTVTGWDSQDEYSENF